MLDKHFGLRTHSSGMRIGRNKEKNKREMRKDNAEASPQSEAAPWRRTAAWAVAASLADQSLTGPAAGRACKRPDAHRQVVYRPVSSVPHQKIDSPRDVSH